jgi:hypothetical protein
VFTPTKWVREMKSVTIKELVTVKEYGSNPTRLANSNVTNK